MRLRRCPSPAAEAAQACAATPPAHVGEIDVEACGGGASRAVSKSKTRLPQGVGRTREHPEVKPDPEIKQEPFTIRGYFGIGE